MKVLIIGAGGQLGTDLCRALDGFDVIGLTHNDIEICDLNSIKDMVNKHKPEAIINTAAYVRVDDSELNQDKAFQVNALGARNLAVASEQLGAKLVHISTDYVFGGQTKPGSTPFSEFDLPMPMNVYGKSKLAGEHFIQHLSRRYFIIRTSGLFGSSGAGGKGGNFVETVLKLAQEQNELRVVSDQVFSPTYTRDLAQKIAELLPTEYYGLFHITNSGSCSWYELAKHALDLTGLKTPLIPVTSREHPQKARRPLYSVLDNYHPRLLGMDDMRPWQEALKDYMIAKGHI